MAHYTVDLPIHVSQCICGLLKCSNHVCLIVYHCLQKKNKKPCQFVLKLFFHPIVPFGGVELSCVTIESFRLVAMVSICFHSSC